MEQPNTMGVPFGVVVSSNQGLTFILIIEVTELKLVAMHLSHHGFRGIVALRRVRGKNQFPLSTECLIYYC